MPGIFYELFYQLRQRRGVSDHGSAHARDEATAAFAGRQRGRPPGQAAARTAPSPLFRLFLDLALRIVEGGQRSESCSMSMSSPIDDTSGAIARDCTGLCPSIRHAHRTAAENSLDRRGVHLLLHLLGHVLGHAQHLVDVGNARRHLPTLMLLQWKSRYP